MNRQSSGGSTRAEFGRSWLTGGQGDIRLVPHHKLWTEVMTQEFQEYPKYLYHPKLAPKGRIFQTPADEPKGWWAGRGWVDTPAKFPKPSRVAALRLWWSEWKWLVELITVILGLITLILGIVGAFIGIF